MSVCVPFVKPIAESFPCCGHLHFRTCRYATFSSLAGVDPADRRAAAAGLAPIDSLDQWPYISGNQSHSARATLHASSKTFLSGRYKLLTGNADNACWAGPLYPNASTASGKHTGAFGSSCFSKLDCGGEKGCLFDVEADPEERHDLGADPTMAGLLEQLQAQLGAANHANFEPDRGSLSTLACGAAARNRGYWGPFID